MANGEIEISQLELSQTVQGDMVMAVDTATDTKGLSITQLNNYISQPLQTSINAVDASALHTYNIANCVVTIPQNINLELNSGVLTVKSGSKAYIPNGSGVYNDTTINSDISTSNLSSITTPYVIFYNPSGGGGLTVTRKSSCFSGGTAPATPQEGYVWYDTANNAIKRYTSGEWKFTLSFPLCVLSSGATSYQTFNGFGYIGKTIFALPNVKVLIPNGRQANGGLKNDEITLNAVKINTITSTGAFTLVITSTNNLSAYNNTLYNEAKNIVTNSSGNRQNVCHCGSITCDADTILSFNPKNVYHSIEWNILSEIYPIGSVYLTTASTCPLKFLIAGSDWEIVSTGILTNLNNQARVYGDDKSCMQLKYVDTSDANPAIHTMISSSAYHDLITDGIMLGDSEFNKVRKSGKVNIVPMGEASTVYADTSSLATKLSVNIFQRIA